MPLSISDSLSCVAGRVIVEVVEYLILLVDGVKETAEELDLFALVLEEFDDLSAIVVEVRAWEGSCEGVIVCTALLMIAVIASAVMGLLI